MAIFALVDCNNFYVSCERIFNPKLENKAVVVLSNNDGCVVARSNESKILGVKMGEPFFQMKARFRNIPIIALSSNYALYADISNRVMQALTAACPEIELYSIDEAFMRLEGYEKLGLKDFSIALKKQIKMEIGIPVSIGIAPTKVLSKIANHIGKKHSANGISILNDKAEINDWLDRFPVDEIWGVGRQSKMKLNSMGIFTAKQLTQMNTHLIQKRFNIVMVKIVQELRGINCLDLNEVQAKKSIVCSRSFSKLQNDLAIISEALSSYSERACEKLRSQNSFTNRISVFLRTNPHKENVPQHHVSSQCKLPAPTNDSRIITKYAINCLSKLYRSNFLYQKVGIMLTEFTTQRQFSLLEEIPQNSECLMSTIDEINHKYGGRTIHLASSGIEQGWKMKRGNVSSRFTTNWKELLKIN